MGAAGREGYVGELLRAGVGPGEGGAGAGRGCGWCWEV